MYVSSYSSSYRTLQEISHALLYRLPFLGTHEYDDPTDVGDAPEQLLEEAFAHEPGGSGDEDILLAVELGNGRDSGLRETRHR